MSTDPRRMTKKKAYRVVKTDGQFTKERAYFHRFIPAGIALSDEALSKYYRDECGEADERFRTTKYDRAVFWKYPDLRDTAFLVFHLGKGDSYEFTEAEEVYAKVPEYTSVTLKTVKLPPFTINFVDVENGVVATINNNTSQEVEYAIQRITRPQPKPEYPINKTVIAFRGKKYEFQLHRNTESFRTRVTLDDEQPELSVQCLDSLGNIIATVYPTKVI